jgi:hypothetical protein
LPTLGGNDDQVNEVAFTPDGNSVITQLGNGKIKVWDLRAVLGRMCSAHHQRIESDGFCRRKCPGDHGRDGWNPCPGTWRAVEKSKRQIGEQHAAIAFSPTDRVVAWARLYGSESELRIRRNEHFSDFTDRWSL